MQHDTPVPPKSEWRPPDVVAGKRSRGAKSQEGSCRLGVSRGDRTAGIAVIADEGRLSAHQAAEELPAGRLVEAPARPQREPAGGRITRAARRLADDGDRLSKS